MLKTLRVESQAMRNAARAERCTLEILGVCSHREETTVLAHLPDESHGISRKSDDISAVFACSNCHNVIDGDSRGWPADEYRQREWYFRRAQTRTWRRLLELGVISIKGVRL
ncbi:nuclease domain-containing protein [Litchfieldella xinjiangensis]|uniref:nuclease domain-containing protein n=1 Tax=Litchfieldella xinjiangensis TaxID=1166948 RepID=UPI0005B8763E|nr:nuclease domain-containing protein [Halomonas xinjiangensis]